jgi:hypothetical protein
MSYSGTILFPGHHTGNEIYTYMSKQYKRDYIYIYKSCPCALTEHHAVEAYWGSGGIAPLIL